jgi:hypothetical protein
MGSFLVVALLIIPGILFGWLVNRYVSETNDDELSDATGLPAMPEASEPRPLLQPGVNVLYLLLSPDQRREILETYRDALSSGMIRWNIKLQSFIYSIQSTHGNEAVPVYFAQRDVVDWFANGRIQWLAEILKKSKAYARTTEVAQ